MGVFRTPTVLREYKNVRMQIMARHINGQIQKYVFALCDIDNFDMLKTNHVENHAIVYLY